MPETELYPRARNSYKEYGFPRTHVEVKVLLNDLRTYPGEWAILNRYDTYAQAVKGHQNYTKVQSRFSLLRKFPNNIEIRVAIDPDEGPMLVIRWVP